MRYKAKINLTPPELTAVQQKALAAAAAGPKKRGKKAASKDAHFAAVQPAREVREEVKEAEEKEEGFVSKRIRVDHGLYGNGLAGEALAAAADDVMQFVNEGESSSRIGHDLGEMIGAAGYGDRSSFIFENAADGWQSGDGGVIQTDSSSTAAAAAAATPRSAPGTSDASASRLRQLHEMQQHFELQQQFWEQHHPGGTVPCVGSVSGTSQDRERARMVAAARAAALMAVLEADGDDALHPGGAGGARYPYGKTLAGGAGAELLSSISPKLLDDTVNALTVDNNSSLQLSYAKFPTDDPLSVPDDMLSCFMNYFDGITDEELAYEIMEERAKDTGKHGDGSSKNLNLNFDEEKLSFNHGEGSGRTRGKFSDARLQNMERLRHQRAGAQAAASGGVLNNNHLNAFNPELRAAVECFTAEMKETERDEFLSAQAPANLANAHAACEGMYNTCFSLDHAGLDGALRPHYYRGKYPSQHHQQPERSLEILQTEQRPQQAQQMWTGLYDGYIFSGSTVVGMTHRGFLMGSSQVGWGAS